MEWHFEGIGPSLAVGQFVASVDSKRPFYLLPVYVLMNLMKLVLKRGDEPKNPAVAVAVHIEFFARGMGAVAVALVLAVGLVDALMSKIGHAEGIGSCHESSCLRKATSIAQRLRGFWERVFQNLMPQHEMGS